MPPKGYRRKKGRASVTPDTRGFDSIHAHFDDDQLILGPTVSPGPKKRALWSRLPTQAGQTTERNDHDHDMEMDRASAASVESVDMFRPRPLNNTTSRADLMRSTATATEEFADDVQLCQRMYAIRDSVEDFARTFPATQNEGFFDELINSDHVELIRYIGCLSLAGNEGETSWQKLLADGECRQALVVGIVGRAMREEMFSALYFGASEPLLAQLKEQEISDANHDGFHRQRRRAAIIEASTSSAFDLELAIMKLTTQLQYLLTPLYTLSGAFSPNPVPALRAPLHTLLTSAASLSRHLKTLPDVIFHWPPTFKDEELEPDRMEIRNLSAMLTSSPYVRQVLPDGDVRGQLTPGQDAVSQALIRVVGFPGLISYRQGGGGLGLEELRYEEATTRSLPPDVRALEPHYDGIEGFRTTMLAKTSVLLQWGKQRLLTTEAGTSRHIDAVANGNMARYQDGDGRKELFEIYVQKLGQGLTMPPPARVGVTTM